MAELHRRTEGWPAGLYLAALYLREGGPLGTAAVSFGGDDRLVSEYMESEFLARISPRHRVFLTRTAVLERMCGPLCEAVLEAARLRRDPGRTLARSNLLLVPLDRRGEWYRYHHLFRDMLLAELERARARPDAGAAAPRRRAGACATACPRRRWSTPWPPGTSMRSPAWWRQLALPAYRQGRAHHHPAVVRGGWRTGTGSRDTRWPPCWPRSSPRRTGGRPRPSGGPMWSIAGSTGTRPGPVTLATEGWAAVLRTLLCRRGVEQMRADADEAVRRFAAQSLVTPAAALLQGIARVLCGDLDGGDASLDEAVSDREEVGAPEISRSRCANDRWWRWHAVTGAGPRPSRRRQAACLRRAGIEDSYAMPLSARSQARVALHRGDVPAARRELVSAQRLRHLLTYAHPHLAVQARIELARVHLALADLAGARTLMREIDELLRRRPDLGTLVGEAEALRARLSAGARSRLSPGRRR